MDGVSACPFCGGSNQRVKSSGRWGWFVSCSCAAVGPSANSRDEAIEAWNTRNEPVQASLFSDAQSNEDKELRELTLDVADVLGENAKLRELAERLRTQLADVTESTSRVEERCAKLRKLLLDVWNDAMQFDGFWDYVNDDGEIYNEDELPHYYDRMRELGIEVD